MDSGEKLVEDLFLNYILPFFMLTMAVVLAAMKVQSLGGPGLLIVIFFIILFGPSLLYALLEDESSGTLFFYSLIAALLTIAIVGFWQFKKKKSQAKLIQKLPLHDIDEEASPMILVFDNNESWLLTEYFPWNNCKITEDMLTKDLALSLGIDIARVDRERFKITTNDSELLKKVAIYIKQNK